MINKLHQITTSDIGKAAQVLGRSFCDYPFFKYVLPNDQYRKKRIRYLFRFIIKMGMHTGEVVAPSRDIEAVSIWVDTSNETSSFMNALKAGIISLYVKTDLKSFKRFCEIGSKRQKYRLNFF